MRSAALIATLSSVSLLLAACSGDSAAQQQQAPPPPEVRIVTVTAQPVPNVVELPGRVQAYRIAEVRARVNGIVQARTYDEGTDVRAGAALFRIDPREFRALLSGQQATLARARATLANAQADVNRFRPLVADGAISRQEYDAAVARVRTGEADVAQARAAVDGAQLNLSYATVTAPISGRANQAQVTEGALVSATEGTLLTTIEQIERVYVNFGQSSAELLALRQDVAAGRLQVPDPGRIAVNLILEDGTAYGFAGFIDFLGLSINPETGTAAIRADVPNPQRVLLPGQFVRARVVAGTRPDGIVVPQRAVRLAQDGASVMLVGANNVAEMRRVVVGDLQGGNWVVQSGLRAGDRVIVDGSPMLQPGQPVRIARAGGAPPSAARPAPARPSQPGS